MCSHSMNSESIRPSSARADSIERIAPSPTFFTAPRPKRTPSRSTVNASWLELMSGGRIGMPRSRHSPRYIASLSVFAASMVSSAAMKCQG